MLSRRRNEIRKKERNKREKYEREDLLFK